MLTLQLAGPALADGGAGGQGSTFDSHGAGGAGGSGSGGTAGGDGGGGGAFYGGGGGGGGAGGGAGGLGGLGAAPISNGGAGGAGGAHGFVGTTINNVAPLAGGDGGNGGATGGPGGGAGGGGGGGGAGGYGAVITDAGVNSNGSTVSGGNGGAGGSSGFGTDGSGGDGGVGLLFSNAGGVTLNNSGSISGGNGGAPGAHFGGSPGQAGVGGVGIVGSGLTINNNGTMSGGLGADGVTRADAIMLTGGTNLINFGTATSGLIGDVQINSGTVQMNAASGGTTVTNTITGGGGLIQNSANTLTLTGINTYSGATTVSAGTLELGSFSAAGTGQLNIGNGAVRVTAAGSGALGNPRIVFHAGTTGTLAAAAGTTVSLGNLGLDVGSTARFGSANDTGTLVLDCNCSGSFVTDNARIIVAGGTLTTTSAVLSFFTDFAAETQVQAGATLDFNSQIAQIRRLTGGGTVKLGSSTLEINEGIFAGGIEGTGGVTVGSTPLQNSTVILSGTGLNTYTGATTVIGNHTLQGGAANAFSAASATTVTGTLDLGGFDQTIGSLAGTGTVTSSGATNATLTAGGDNTSTLFSGVIKDGAAATALTKTGIGTLTLSGVNTYTGGTTISGGTLAISANNNLGANTGGLTFNGGTLQFGASFDLANTRAITLNAGGGTFDTNGFDTTVSQAIAGTGSLTKTGNGTLTLSGVNTYTGGTTIEAGTLRAGVAGAFVGNTAYAVNGGTLDLNGFKLTMSSLSGTGGTVALGAAALTINQATNTSYAGALIGSGSLTKAGTGTLTLSGANTYTGATTVNSGQLSAASTAAFSASSAFTLNGNASLNLNGNSNTIGSLASASSSSTVNLGTATLTTGGDNTSTTFAGSITGGALVKDGNGTFTLSGTNTYSGSTVVKAGTLRAGAANSFSSNSNIALQGTATLDLNNFDQTIAIISGSSGTVSLGSATLTIGNNTTVGGFAGNITGTGGITKVGSQFLTLSGTGNTYSGATTVAAGWLLAGATNAFSPNSAFIVNSGALVIMGGFDQTIGSLAGGGAFRIDEKTLTAGGDNTSTVFSGGMRGSAASTFNKAGSGTMIVSGNNSAFFGAVNVTDGTLAVDGSIASSRMTTVNSDARLTGTGTVGNTTIAGGGIFAPGSGTPDSSMNISGSLVLQSGAQYLVQLNRSTASFASVSGSAELGGATVNAFFARDAYVEKQYRIVTASGGVTGSFDSVVETNLPSGFHTSLSTDNNNAYLNLVLNFVPPPNGGLNGNQQRVADAIVGFFNANDGIPMVFGGLNPAGLTQISGETAISSQQTTFNAMTQFMGVMTDPFVAGRGEGGFVGGSATGYADEQSLSYAQPHKLNDALAAIYSKAPRALSFEQRWSVWAAGFGGAQTTDGNAAAGSNNTASSIYGTAVGADYRFSPDTLAGFALAGGGTNFSVANGGSGRSDLFQAGAFVRHHAGPAYISAALAYGWQDITTDRTVTIAGVDQLRANFNANAFSGRVEGGYRFVTPVMGITPYAAGQFTTFDLPAYAEQARSGTDTFALDYAAKSVTASRSELGVRTDRSWAMTDAILTLRGRVAWAHDFNPDRNIAATFQTLPGASFVVNGAAQASDSALVTGAAEMKWLNGFSVAATFEGEFSNVTESYAGKGVVRYAW